MPANSQVEKKVHRLQFMFWLDVMRPEEEELAEYVEYLKQKRSFAKTIRDALRLIWDLKAGKVDVLLFLFPWIADYFAKQQIEPVHAHIPEEDPLRQQIARLEALMLQQGNTAIPDGVKPSQAMLQNPQPALRLNAPDDTAIEVKKVGASADNRAVYNFLISTSRSNNTLETLPEEVVEYGLRIGKISPSEVKRKAKRETRNQESGTIKTLEVPQFAPPSFDDDDDSIEVFT